MTPKFRAWLLDEQEMVNVQGIDFVGEMVYHAPTISPYSDKTHFSGCVIMQSTGVKDSAGNEVFEGDVVKIKGHEDDSKYPTVITRTVGGGFTAMTNGVPFNWYNFAKIGGGDFVAQVIGNVYQHSQLLEKTA